MSTVHYANEESRHAGRGLSFHATYFKVPPCWHPCIHTTQGTYSTFTPHSGCPPPLPYSVLISNLEWNIVVPIHKWRPMSPPTNPPKISGDYSCNQKNLRKVLAGWSWKPTEMSSSETGSGRHRRLLQNKMERENNKLHPNSQLGKNAWHLNWFLWCQDGLFTPLPRPHVRSHSQKGTHPVILYTWSLKWSNWDDAAVNTFCWIKRVPCGKEKDKKTTREFNLICHWQDINVSWFPLNKLP